jgi:hypothetical protein
MSIQLNILREDLSFLYTAKMNWNKEWIQINYRFEDVLGYPVNFEDSNAYWLPDWTTAMIFRAYLESINGRFQILLDNAEGMEPYVVITKEEF